MRGVLAVVLLVLATPAARAEEGATTIGEPAGEAIWEADCAGCHRDVDRALARVSWALTGQPPPERAVWLRDFILNHHTPARDKVEVLAAWLAQR
ncbi:hypothetical protein [Paenirhodobacter hankyongi]|uniref:Cytochrome c n=1 Tax=Paenirhodobacter hankyongi TaxID=2294033 RepID=A0A421BRM2_9RHOB|nr:hypothetical protein [Sinirhodobacter hankyongi]RLL70920.1 hypothetical protein DYS74_06675 [Sinirhodobacter hankyongi]